MKTRPVSNASIKYDYVARISWQHNEAVIITTPNMYEEEPDRFWLGEEGDISKLKRMGEPMIINKTDKLERDVIITMTKIGDTICIWGNGPSYNAQTEAAAIGVTYCTNKVILTPVIYGL